MKPKKIVFIDIETAPQTIIQPIKRRDGRIVE